MSKRRSDRHHQAQAIPTDDLQLLRIILHCNSDNTHHHFRVPGRMSVADFLQLALARLSEGDGAERVEALKRYYQPVLEMQNHDGSHELSPDVTLAEAGLVDNAICRIAARPLKERLMFCSYDKAGYS